jgi:hypothetical protein
MLLHQFKPIYYRNRKFGTPDELISVADKELTRVKTALGDISHISESYLHGSLYSKNILEQINVLSDLNFVYSNPFGIIDVEEPVKDSGLVKEKFNLFCAAAGVAYRVA